MSRSRSRRTLARCAVVLLVGLSAGLGSHHTVATFGTFSGTTSNPNSSFAAMRVFAGARFTSAWKLGDSSSGTEADNSDLPSFADSRVQVTGNWSTAFSSTRYLEFDLSASQPAGLSVTQAQFNLTMASNTNGDTSCFYFEVRRASTNALLGTKGSSGSPVFCTASSTLQTTTTDITTLVTSTDILNDLRIQVYSRNSGSRPWKVDLATVSGTTASTTFTMYERVGVDASTGVAVSTPWSLYAVDATTYTSASNLTSAFASTRYLKFTLSGDVPTGSSITAVSLNFTYKAATAGNTSCYYFETYNASTLLATHGSSGSPQGCNATSSFVTDTVSLAEVTTAAAANNLVLKIYEKDSGSRKSLTDMVKVTFTYSLT